MERWAYFSEHGLGGVRQSAGEAIVWYRKAAHGGNAPALFWTALRETDPDVARLMLKKAADAGYAPAMAKLAEASGNDAMLRAAAELGDTSAMLRLGGEWLRKAADSGNREALARLGRTEEAAARGHTPSLVKLGRFEEAARLGDPEGLYRFGLSLADKAEGSRWIQRAAEAGHAAAMRELGLRYRDGSGAPVDAETSVRWLRAAAAAGDPQALYENGDARSAAEKGYAPAMVRLAEETGDRAWLERAAAAGYANAWTKLGNPERAAAAGDPEAKVLLADKDRNAKNAYRLYVEAARSGYAPGMLRAGDCHMEGRGASRSEIDAVNWYRQAARAGSREALDKLAKLGKTL
jgi:TPR repeat protein